MLNSEKLWIAKSAYDYIDRDRTKNISTLFPGIGNFIGAQGQVGPGVNSIARGTATAMGGGLAGGVAGAGVGAATGALVHRLTKSNPELAAVLAAAGAGTGNIAGQIAGWRHGIGKSVDNSNRKGAPIRFAANHVADSLRAIFAR